MIRRRQSSAARARASHGTWHTLTRLTHGPGPHRPDPAIQNVSLSTCRGPHDPPLQNRTIDKAADHPPSTKESDGRTRLSLVRGAAARTQEPYRFSTASPRSSLLRHSQLGPDPHAIEPSMSTHAPPRFTSPHPGTSSRRRRFPRPFVQNAILFCNFICSTE